jgi:hypothetical protein
MLTQLPLGGKSEGGSQVLGQEFQNFGHHNSRRKKSKNAGGDADDIRVLNGDFSRAVGIEPQKK